MQSGRRVFLQGVMASVALGLALVGCSPPRATSGSEAREAAPAPGTQQRALHVVIRDEPAMMNVRLDRNGEGFPLTVPLLYRDDRDGLRGLLAERAPTQDDGSWVINADGTMKTTYVLKADLKWQDGKPHTAHDFVFTWQVYTDRDVPLTTRVPESLMSEVIARDDRTLEISWKETYIWANALTGNDLAPIPRHLLEDLYRTEKTNFATSSFWITPGEFVGNGPYRLAEWERGVSYTATANPYFAMGKPRIETVVYHFVQDANTLIANFLAGILDFGQYTAITSEMGVTLRDRWQAENAGRIYSDTLFGVRIMEFQHREVPGAQKAIRDLRVRRAVVHAIDREALAEELQYGFTTAADTIVPRNSPLYPRVEQAITKYPYDVRGAEQLLNEAGWTRGPDGRFRDSAGQLLDTEVRATSENGQVAQIVSDYWKRAGLNSTPYTIPRAQINDQEVRTGFPFAGLSANSYARDFVGVRDVTAEQAPTPQNRFTGKNRGTYLNSQLDNLWDTYQRTVDQRRQDDLVVEMSRLFTADVAQGPLFYLPRIAAVRTGLVGIRPPVQGGYSWNLWEWSWS